MKVKVGGHEVNVSNPDKIFFPKRKLKKIDLVEYYVDVAPCALPHLRRRLFHMKRFPNGVDASAFSSAAPDHHDPELISFIGRMDYYPNQEGMLRFCEQVWPLLKARRPSLKLVIVGAEPPPFIRALGELPGVEVSGSVPKVQPYVLKSCVNVAPLAIARGTQNKILEAMAMGVPVITSAIAAGGVDAEAESHLLVADTAAELTQAVLRIAENPDERRRLAVAGRQRVLSHHAWPRSMQRLDGIIQRCRDSFAPLIERAA